MPSLKNLLQPLLCRWPALHDLAITLKGNASPEKRLFIHLVRPHDTVLDIGANRGHFTTLFSHLTGPCGQVHAFEPAPPTFARLSLTLARFPKGRPLHLHNLALSDHQGHLDLLMPGDDDGQASILPHHTGSWQGQTSIVRHRCQVTTLDSWEQSNPLHRLDFVKMDIEGAEPLALRGARQTLLRHQPLLFLEICPDWLRDYSSSPESLADLLSTLGYTQFHLLRHHLQPLPPAQRPFLPPDFTGSANLLCSTSSPAHPPAPRRPPPRPPPPMKRLLLETTLHLLAPQNPHPPPHRNTP